jgi:CPA1 family monovalent cation:H+ antiporter
MTSTIQILILLLVIIAAVAVISNRSKIPTSILLVLAGVALALIPALPSMELEPELVLLLVLPPVVYSSAVAMSWREFRFNLRPIVLLAVGAVLFTTVAVAAAVHYVLGFPWAAGFVLGAIVSPPDVIAPLSIARRLQIPHRILVVLEGEGLANDATALILYRFAVVAVSAGAFSFEKALGSFVAIVVGEILWGIGVGWLMLRLRRWAHDPRIELTLSVLTPFLAYWPPQYLGGSGVLATVTTGLYMSWNGLRLISAATRLQGIFFWGFLLYLIEGMVFLITGLQARQLLPRIEQIPLGALAEAVGLVCGVVILTRFIWIYPTIYLPRWLSKRLRKRDPSPPWTWPFAIGFTGVRGIVSLAAALAIPFETDAGQAFPGRDLILFLTFSVIVITLVGQGLLLPAVIRGLGLANAGRREHLADREEEFAARQQAIEAALDCLRTLTTQRNLADEITQPIHARHRERLRHVRNRGDGDDAHRQLTALEDEIEQLLIQAERDRINDLYSNGSLKDEARRHIERELDLREAHLANLQTEE